MQTGRPTADRCPKERDFVAVEKRSMLGPQQEQLLRDLKRNGGFLPGASPHPELVEHGYVREAERPILGDPPAGQSPGTVHGFELTEKGNDYPLGRFLELLGADWCQDVSISRAI